MISTTPRSSSAGRSTGTATGGRRRRTAQRGRCRSHESSRSFIGRHKLAARYCCPGRLRVRDWDWYGAAAAQRVSCPAAKRRLEQSTWTDDRRSRSFTRPTLTKDPCRFHAAVFPSMHSFRHTVASFALLAGESVDEVAFLLGHRDGTVTRSVYVPRGSRCPAPSAAAITDDDGIRRRAQGRVGIGPQK